MDIHQCSKGCHTFYVSINTMRVSGEIGKLTFSWRKFRYNTDVKYIPSNVSIFAITREQIWVYYLHTFNRFRYVAVCKSDETTSTCSNRVYYSMHDVHVIGEGIIMCFGFFTMMMYYVVQLLINHVFEGLRVMKL